MNNKGCIDAVVNHTVNAIGLQEWSIHLYKAIPPLTQLGWHLPQSNGHAANDDSHLHTVYQCVGNVHHFRVVVDSSYSHVPGQRPKECQRVADGLTDVDMSNAKEALSAVPVDNTSWYYSNQVWVFDALDALFDIGLLPDDHYALAHIMLCEFHQRVEDINIVVSG